jgi:serine/threonine protein kinase
VSPASDPDRWARIADLFDRALSVRAEDRDAWLVAVCQGDRELHDEVQSLLHVHARAGDLLTSDARPEAPLPALPPAPIGSYRVQRVLGVGGMGVVYLAEDSKLGRLVALKVVSPQFAGDPARVARLRREARTAASLAHPNIATVFALEQEGDQLFMVSEYVAGETLRDQLRRGPFSVAEAVDVVLTITRAVAAAHSQGIVHRDLKPENIVRTPAGELKVLDFGLAVTAEPTAGHLTADGAALGTPAYMSPEQIRGGPVDARSDQFALGVLLYELVTGAHPFLARSQAATLARILEAEPAPIATRLASLGAGVTRATTERLQGIIDRCLHKRPDQRFADTGALAAALERFREAPSPTTAAPPPAAMPSRAVWWWQFHQAAVTMSYVLLLIPMWRLRQMPDLWTLPALPRAGVLLFLIGVVAVVVAGSLRLHLWFAMRQYPDAWSDQHRLARRWIRAADVAFAAVLAGLGLAATRLDEPSAPLLVAASASVVVTFLVVEPATTRAARHSRQAS